MFDAASAARGTMNTVPNIPVRSGKAAALPAEPAPPHAQRSSHKRLGLALAVATVSDVLSFFVSFVPPLLWAVDIATALLLFLILGRRWAILPGLVTEAIPGMGVFPAWILVVVSIILYDDIRRSKR